jgi:hypothetical protein
MPVWRLELVQGREVLGEPRQSLADRLEAGGMGGRILRDGEVVLSPDIA